MTDTQDQTVLAYADDVAARAMGEEPAHHVVAAPIGMIPSVASQTVFADAVERASGHTELGARLPRKVRMGWLKHLILRLTRPITNEQRVYNAAVVDALRGMDSSMVALERRLAGVQAAIATAELLSEQSADQARSAVEAARTSRDELARLVRQVTVERSSDRSELRVLQARLDMMLREVRAGNTEAAGTIAGDILDERTTSLYVDFENVFRGTSDYVKALLRPYLADIDGHVSDAAPLFDIGPGRGDWLELLREEKQPAYGVDTNERFVREAVERGLDVRLGDAVAHLRTVPEASLGAITAFHVAEHLPVEVLVEMIGGALQALRPGGILILETPNPGNIIVASQQFYLDPTHRRPLPADLLAFLVEHAGFVDVEKRYLHPRQEWTPARTGGDEAQARVDDEIGWALYGPMDYAIVARRAALR